MAYDAWLAHYLRNPERQRELDAAIPWGEPCSLPPAQRRALAHSLQRFELGESGEGALLLAKAEEAGDETYLAALRLFVLEEQRHSALFLRALGYLGAEPLTSHWSDAAFTGIRRALGLRLELMLFLTAEVIALRYFAALESGPDPVVRAIATRVLSDEVDHVRFQIHRLGDGFAETSSITRAVVKAGWWVIAIGATVVVAWDHRSAMRVCGLPALAFVRTALGDFRIAAADVLDRHGAGVTGPGALASSPPLVP